MTVHSPLFEAPIEGGMFLAQPDHPGTGAPGAENPFDALLSLYLIAKASDRGVIVKLAGQVQPDPATGRARRHLRPSAAAALLHGSTSTSAMASAARWRRRPGLRRSYESRVDLNPWLDPSRTYQNALHL